MDQIKLIELVYAAFPLKEFITNLDVTTEKNAIRFTWRDIVFRVSENLNVDRVIGKLVCGDEISIIAEQLIRKTYSNNTMRFEPQKQ